MPCSYLNVVHSASSARAIVVRNRVIVPPRARRTRSAISALVIARLVTVQPSGFARYRRGRRRWIWRCRCCWRWWRGGRGRRRRGCAGRRRRVGIAVQYDFPLRLISLSVIRDDTASILHQGAPGSGRAPVQYRAQRGEASIACRGIRIRSIGKRDIEVKDNTREVVL